MNPLSIDPLDKLKDLNIRKNLSSDDDALSSLVSNIDDTIDDLSDIQSDEMLLPEAPDSNAMNDYLDAVSGDIMTAKDAIKKIPNIITEEYNISTSGIAIVESKISKLQDSLSNLKLATERRGSVARVFITGNLTSKDSVNEEFPLSSARAFVDFTTGSVSLASENSTPIKDAIFKVLKSNRPNDRDVSIERPVDFFYEGRYYNYADSVLPEGDDFHLSIKSNPSRLASAISTDEELDTVRAKVFDGDIDSSWVCEYVQSSVNPDKTPLNVKILVDMGVASTISSLSIIPYLLNDGDVLDILSISGGINTSEMKKLNVFKNVLSEDTNNLADKPEATSGPYDADYSNNINVSFDPVEAQYLIIELQQGNMVNTPYILLDIPVSRESPIGIETQRFSLDYLQSIALSSRFGADISSDELISSLFNLGGGWSLQSSLSNVIKEDRVHQAIGISEIKLSNESFEVSSQFVSTEYKIPDKKILSVSINVDEVIPSSFPDLDWIKYDISFDGNTFNPISATGSGRRKDNVSFNLKAPEDAQSITLMATLSRPAELQSLTPIIRGYKIEVEVE